MWLRGFEEIDRVPSERFDQVHVAALNSFSLIMQIRDEHLNIRVTRHLLVKKRCELVGNGLLLSVTEQPDQLWTGRGGGYRMADPITSARQPRVAWYQRR